MSNQVILFVKKDTTLISQLVFSDYVHVYDLKHDERFRTARKLEAQGLVRLKHNFATEYQVTIRRGKKAMLTKLLEEMLSYVNPLDLLLLTHQLISGNLDYPEPVVEVQYDQPERMAAVLWLQRKDMLWLDGTLELTIAVKKKARLKLKKQYAKLYKQYTKGTHA